MSDDDYSLTWDEAQAVYDVLTYWAEASSDDYDRDSFAFQQTGGFVPEYRFMGSLGFGGKFWRGPRDERWYVSAYSEDMTLDRRRIVAATNAALDDLHDLHVARRNHS